MLTEGEHCLPASFSSLLLLYKCWAVPSSQERKEPASGGDSPQNSLIYSRLWRSAAPLNHGISDNMYGKMQHGTRPPSGGHGHAPLMAWPHGPYVCIYVIYLHSITATIIVFHSQQQEDNIYSIGTEGGRSCTLIGALVSLWKKAGIWRHLLSVSSFLSLHAALSS